MEKEYKKIAVEISRIILGVVFVFSGFVKAVDPLGGVYKIQDYLLAFEFTDFNFWATPVAFLQAAVEFGVGACLLLGIYRRFNSTLVFLIMLFMTPLTLYLALTNPVKDCGCFGDALVISNWLTFSKNVVLLIAAIIVFMWNRLMFRFFTRKGYSYTALWVYVFIIGVSLYCYYYLPVFDFRPYKIGVNIPKGMEIPENAEHDIYETKLIYADIDGKQKEFTIENYPKGDTSWTFVNSRPYLIKKGYQPPIHDFSITDLGGADITEKVLSDPSYTFLLISHKLKEARDSNIDKINDIFDFSKANEYGFYALTSSSSSEIKEWDENTGAEYLFCTGDDVTLKTIVRSNPGLLLIKGGTIINKWPNTRLPDIDKLKKILEDANQGYVTKPNNFGTLILLALILLIPLAALFFRYRKRNKTNPNRESKSNNSNRVNDPVSVDTEII